MNILKSAAYSIILAFLGNSMAAQMELEKTTSMSNAVEMFSSGNGHGGFMGLTCAFDDKSRSIGLSPFFQMNTGRFAGTRLIFNQSLSTDRICHKGFSSYSRDLVQLNLYMYLQYNKAARLSNTIVSDEKMIRRDTDSDLNSVKLATGEVGSGIEVQINLTPSITLKNRIAASVYHHYNYVQLMSHARTALSLHLGTALCITIN
jgi:hypothetical protein